MSEMHVKDVHGKTVFIGWMCDICGVLILDRDVHNKWHQFLAKMFKVAGVIKTGP